MVFLENRNNLEELLSTFCKAKGIEFISLKPQLEQLASQGKLGYLSADTHWNELGQATAIEPIKNWLEINLNN